MKTVFPFLLFALFFWIFGFAQTHHEIAVEIAALETAVNQMVSKSSGFINVDTHAKVKISEQFFSLEEYEFTEEWEYKDNAKKKFFYSFTGMNWNSILSIQRKKTGSMVHLIVHFKDPLFVYYKAVPEDVVPYVSGGNGNNLHFYVAPSTAKAIEKALWRIKELMIKTENLNPQTD